MRIFLISLQFGRDHEVTMLQTIRAYLNREWPHYRPVFCQVDNRLTTPTLLEAESNRFLINGDNSGMEFSGYDRGFNWLRDRVEPSSNDLVIVLNDTFHRSYGSDYLNLFSKELVKHPLENGSLIGYFDEFPEVVKLFEFHFQRWIRSSFILSTWGTISKLVPFNQPIPTESIFGDSDNFFNDTTLLSENYKLFLKNWLLKTGQPKSGSFTESWHSAKELNESTFPALKAKACSIFREHLFSARADSAGIQLFNVRSKSLVVTR